METNNESFSNEKEGLISKFFKFRERKTNLKTEIIGGLITFVCMCYILPVNSGILSAMGMNTAGVFAMTAIVGALCTLIMGLVANYPISLSAGMGLNAFLTFTVALQIFGETGNAWQKAMITLTISGILFFVFSLTPLRAKIINAIPKDIKAIICGALGMFICFVGLKGSGLIAANGATLVAFGQLIKPINTINAGTVYDPSALIALVGIILVIVLMFIKTKWKSLNGFAIPITLGVCAVISIICAYSGLNIYGGVDLLGNYNNGLVDFTDGKAWLPSGIQDVLFFGYVGKDAPTVGFGELLVDVLATPSAWIAMFSLIFVNLFDTTSTLIAVGRDADILDSEGQLKDGQKAVLSDAVGALVCGPLGTSTVTSFVESTAGVAYGAKTGMAAVSSALMFLLCIFLYPIFSFFTASCVTAPALFGVGLMIFINNIKDIDWKNRIIAATAFIGLIFTVLTYSISLGLGLALISYCTMMVATKKGKEVSVAIYVIAAFYLLDIILSELLLHL